MRSFTLMTERESYRDMKEIWMVSKLSDSEMMDPIALTLPTSSIRSIIGIGLSWRKYEAWWSVEDYRYEESPRMNRVGFRIGTDC